MYKPRSLLESLEARSLFAVTLGSDGVLHVTGTDAADTLSFTKSGISTLVNLNGVATSVVTAEIASLNIDLGNGTDTLTLDRTQLDVDTTANLGAGSDTVTVVGGPGAGQLDLNGGGNYADQLIVSLQGVTDIIRIGEGTVVREGPFSLDPALQYASFSNLNIEGGTQQDTIVVEHVAENVFVSIKTYGGNDSVTFGDGANQVVAVVQTRVTLDLGEGDDSLTIDDSAATEAVTYESWLSTSLDRRGWSTIETGPHPNPGLERIVIEGGRASDLFVLNGTLTPMSIDGNGFESGTGDRLEIRDLSGTLQNSHMPPAADNGIEGYLTYYNGTQLTFTRIYGVSIVNRHVGFVFDDLNNSGWRDAGEPGVQGVLIEEHVMTPDGLVRIPLATSGPSGMFYFHRTGAVTMHMVVPEGMYQSRPLPGEGFVGNPNGIGQNYNYTYVFGLSRTPPNGMVAGRAFQDNDRDGMLDPSDQVLSGVEIFLDEDFDGVRDPGEAWTLTDAQGNYRIQPAPVGDFKVWTALPSGYEQAYTRTTAVGMRGELYHDVILVKIPSPDVVFGHTYEEKFINWEDYLIGVPGVTAYLDLDNDRQLDSGEPRAVSDAEGHYEINGVAAGEYQLRFIYPVGYKLDRPSDAHTIVKVDGVGMRAPYAVGNPDATPAMVLLRPFIDNDGDGKMTEPIDRWDGNPDWVWIDVNRNGIKDDYAAPEFSWVENLPPGEYVVRTSAPAGATITGLSNGSWGTIDVRPGARLEVFIGFKLAGTSGSISGKLFYDNNRNGKQDAGELPSTGLVYIDENKSGSFQEHERFVNVGPDGSYRFDYLAPGTHWIGRKFETSRNEPVDVLVGGPFNGRNYTFVLGDNSAVAGADFALFYVSKNPGVPAGAVSGRVFFDANKNGAFESSETGLAGRTVWADKDNDKVLDADERSAVTDAGGYYTIYGLTVGIHKIRQIVPTGWAQTYPTNGYGVDVNLTQGGLAYAPHHGVYSAGGVGGTGSISGYFFWDADKDGTEDLPADVRQGSKIVYIDANNNAKRDSGEKQLTTNANGEFTFTNLAAGVYRIRRDIPKGYYVSTPDLVVTLGGGDSVTGLKIGTAQGTAPVTPPPVVPPPVNPPPVDPPPVVPPPVNPPPVTTKGSISGFAFNDNDGDGVVDTGDTRAAGKVIFLDANNNGKLDSGEKQTTTNTQGIFTFTGLDAGTYRVRRVFPSGYRMSSAPLDVTLAAGENETDLTIGSTNRLLVSGTVFNDANNNKLRDSAESGLEGWRVFVDANNNGVFDSSEKSVLTDATGKYAFTDLAAATYKFRVQAKTGWTGTTTSPISLTLASGAVNTNSLFGQRQIA